MSGTKLLKYDLMGSQVMPWGIFPIFWASPFQLGYLFLVYSYLFIFLLLGDRHYLRSRSSFIAGVRANAGILIEIL